MHKDDGAKLYAAQVEKFAMFWEIWRQTMGDSRHHRFSFHCPAATVVQHKGGEGIYTAQKIRFMQDRHWNFVAVFGAFHYLIYY
jgi:hypothetical protein